MARVFKTAITADGDITASGFLKSTASSGDEGGQIDLAKSVTNTTLTTGVTLDVYQNKLRIFETGGTNRGYYIDITGGGASVGTNLVGGGSGTVTSVAITTPTGLTVSGSPITTSGTLALTLTSGYAIPTTTQLASYLTAEADTLSTVTGRGATTATALTLTNATDTTTASDGALVISGGLNVLKNANIQKDLFVGASAITQTSVTTNPSIIAKDAGSTYTQIAMINSSSTGSSDFAAYSDNGSDTAGWVDMGFTGSNFSDAAYTITGKNDGYVFTQAVSGAGLTGNLVLATGANGTTNDIIFGTSGFLAANERMRLVAGTTLATSYLNIKSTKASTSTTTGALIIAGGLGIAGATFATTVSTTGLTLAGTTSPITLNASVGTSGQVLTSAGASATPTWRDGPVDGTTGTAATGFGFMGIPQNATTSGSYTVVASDAGKHLYSTNTRTVTINSNANVAFPVGTTVTFISGSGATTTIAITGDTMYLAGPGTTGSRTLAPFGMATAVKITTTSWMISGNGLT